jgi:putative membrane protein
VTAGGLPSGERPAPDQPEQEPDYRFSLANERTYLAWIRTALALVGAGVAVIRFLPPLPIPGARELLGAVLVLVGTLVAASSHRRWRRIEQAMRTGTPLPASLLPPLLTATVAAVSFCTLVLLLLEDRG